MVMAGVNEMAELIDVHDGVDQRALPSREQRDDENKAQKNGTHARQVCPNG